MTFKTNTPHLPEIQRGNWCTYIQWLIDDHPSVRPSVDVGLIRQWCQFPQGHGQSTRACCRDNHRCSHKCYNYTLLMRVCQFLPTHRSSFWPKFNRTHSSSFIDFCVKIESHHHRSSSSCNNKTTLEPVSW